MFGTELLFKVNFPIPDNAQKNVVETKGKTKKKKKYRESSTRELMIHTSSTSNQDGMHAITYSKMSNLHNI